MRKLLILAFSAALFAQMACQQEGITTEHGFRFINHTNTGGEKPQPGQTVLFHFEAYIGDSLMSSTRKNFGEPREIQLPTADQLPKRVPAVYDALLLSGVGDSVTIYEKIDSFLQRFVPKSLQDEKEARYEIVLKKIVSQEEIQKKQEEEQQKMLAMQQQNEEAKKRFPAVSAMVKATAADYRTGKLNDQLKSTASGLKFRIIEQGSGEPLKQGEPIDVHYFGALTNGTMFDNSFERGQTLPFPVGTGRMIKGFDEGAMMLNHGGKAYFFIPPQIGYGDQPQGTIPPNSELIFYIEVL